MRTISVELTMLRNLHLTLPQKRIDQDFDQAKQFCLVKIDFGNTKIIFSDRSQIRNIVFYVFCNCNAPYFNFNVDSTFQ